jgi:hypothetical protein
MWPKCEAKNVSVKSFLDTSDRSNITLQRIIHLNNRGYSKFMESQANQGFIIEWFMGEAFVLYPGFL